MSGERALRAGLDVAQPLIEFVDETLTGTGIDPDDFWTGLAGIFEDLTPVNRGLLATRDLLQSQLDAFHLAEPGQPDPQKYRALLEDIGYLVTEPGEFTIETSDVDVEIASLAGPQLVVPLLNARFAVNAANARWGSLYDALYGTDAISDDEGRKRGGSYNPIRGAEVVRRGREILDSTIPLSDRSHDDVDHYEVIDGALAGVSGADRVVLRDASQFVGYRGSAADPSALLFVHNGLHIEIVIDRDGVIGRTDRAGVQDIALESALTTIMDLEDSVAAVDAEDKALGYRNWRDLMRGTLSERVVKGDRDFVRTLNPDRTYTAVDDGTVTVPGRSLLLIRNVGHLMTTDAVRDSSGAEVPEGILDAAMTALGTLADLSGPSRGRNSRTGSMYVVKPKMHGPEEVAFSVELFGRVEQLLGLPARTIKIGIMDEERRTSANLRASIFAARDRLAFINTGFLDRTGDEIHTSLHAGPMAPKSEMKSQPFMRAYELRNVEAGIDAGLPGRAQIGKGMWAMPDLMSDMLEQKSAHVRSGATTAWVPSPTAATLHALHYHEIDVPSVQAGFTGRTREGLDDLLVIPLATTALPDEVIADELDNNVQSILGYVVRWVDQGVGCSKVPDIRGVGLMEDRATLRISSQLLANWLAHGIIGEGEVDDSLRRLAEVVDGQNAADPDYETLIGPDGPGLAFEAARRLIVEGANQPSGYTEPILHAARRQKKAQTHGAQLVAEISSSA